MSEAPSLLTPRAAHHSRLAFFRKPVVSIPLAFILGVVVAGCVQSWIMTTVVGGGQPVHGMTVSHYNVLGVGIAATVFLAYHAALWPRQFARRAKFSLRTLLALVAVAALVTSLALVPALRKHSQEAAAQRLGAAPVFEGSNAVALEFLMAEPGPGKLLDPALVELRNFLELRTLSLRFTWITDAGLARVAELPKLEKLELGHTYYFNPATDLDSIPHGIFGINASTPAGVQQLRNLAWNHSLVLRNKQITDAGMSEVAKIASLRSLSLEHTAIADQGLRKLKSLPNLEELVLSMTFVTDDGLKHLAGFPKLRRLNIGSMRFITDAGMVHVSRLTPLTELKLPASITDKGLSRLGTLRNLQVLDLSECPCSPEGTQRLQKQLPRCRIVPPRKLK